MDQQNYEKIPSLDLSEFNSSSPQKQKRFILELGNSFQHLGFATLKNHMLSPGIVAEFYEVVKEFFALPTGIKESYERKESLGERGYVGKGKEHAKGVRVGDLKEFFHIGQELPDQHALKQEYPENLWPKEVKNFREVSLKIYREFERVGRQVLQAIALFLEEENLFLVEKTVYGNSILRAIHYFPISPGTELEKGAVRAAEHCDINLITLLVQASAEGLQVKNNEGKWLPVEASPDHLVINVGDMLSRLTNGKLKSTVHRVVNPPLEKMHLPRYSIPFFMHPRPSVDLSCLESCIDADHPKKYNNITAGQFLEERLAENGLKV